MEGESTEVGKERGNFPKKLKDVQMKGTLNQSSAYDLISRHAVVSRSKQIML